MPTPDELVQLTLKDWVYQQDNDLRIQNYKIYESYYDGTFDQDLPNFHLDPQLFHCNSILSPRIREALESDFRVISNYAKTVVNKAVGYLCADPIAIEVKPNLVGLDGDDEETVAKKETAKKVAKEAERILYDVYRYNNFLKKNIIKLIRIQGKKGDVFVKCYIDKNDKLNPIRLTVLKPDIVFVKFNQDNYDEFEYIAIIYTKTDENGQFYKYAQVWWADVWKEYVIAPGENTWKEISKQENEIGIIPIVHIKNTNDEKPWGESDIEVIMTLIDASCKAFTDLMVNADYQAFQRVITTGYEGLPAQSGSSGASGSRENKPKTGPGTMVNIPGENVGVTVVEPADPQGLINIIDALAQEISTHGRIPKIALSRTDGAGQASSLSLRIHYQPLDEKCNEKATLASDGLEELNWIIFHYHKLLTREDYTELETEVRFSKSLPSDKLEDSQVLDTEIRNKIKSRETAMQEIGINDVEAERQKIQEEDQLYSTDIYGQRLNSDIENLLGGGPGGGPGGAGGPNNQGGQNNQNNNNSSSGK